MKGKRFIGVVMSERQARHLLMYLDCLTLHGAGRNTAKALHEIKVKVSRALKRTDAARDESTQEGK